MLQHTLPAGFIPPSLPTKTDKLPSGSEWLHEIKHDGFRIIARKNRAQVLLYSRPGNDLTYRFPLIVPAQGAARRAFPREVQQPYVRTIEKPKPEYPSGYRPYRSGQPGDWLTY
jgi:ATP dependent DNA ligase domain